MTTAAPRYPLEFPVILSPEKVGVTKISGRISNLSSSGLGVLTGSEHSGLRPGMTFLVTFQLDEKDSCSKRIQLRARLIWADRNRCGLQILNMSEQTRFFYENLLAGYKTLLEFSANNEISAGL